MTDTARTVVAAAMKAHGAGNVREAERLYRTALDIEQDHAAALANLAVICLQDGRTDEAETLLTRAITLKPANVAWIGNLARFYASTERWSDAGASYQRLVDLEPDVPEHHKRLADMHLQQGDDDDALEGYAAALKLDPQLKDALLAAANIHSRRSDWAAAFPLYVKLSEMEPGNPNHLVWRGYIAGELGQDQESETSYLRALRTDPGNSEASERLGQFYSKLDRWQDAIRIWEAASAAHPSEPKFLAHLAAMSTRTGAAEAAASYWQKVVNLEPAFEGALGRLFIARRLLCDWQDYDNLESAVEQATQKALGDGGPMPETLLTNVIRAPDPALNLAVAKRVSGFYGQHADPIDISFDHSRQKLAGEPLRVGYVSNDFMNHATSHLMASFFGLHDRSKVHVTIYSYGRDDGSGYRRKIEADCDSFVDIISLSDADAARKIYEDEIDILVDLKGETFGTRQTIFALRPAPVQVAWLGFPGSSGADFIDYILTDQTVTPPADLAHFSECPAWLPNSYQVTDSEQPIADTGITRASCDLPDSAFVFANLCTPYKLEPQLFAIWMDVLKAVPDSVLWLMKPGGDGASNLRRAAQAHGVAGGRLVMADHRPKAQHLERLGLADLVLDTLICNGHTTTSDALWAGVPVLTMAGSHFASRVSASILKAIKLPPLITDDRSDYQAMAIKLATDAALLLDIKSDLAQKRLTTPLFDTATFVRDVESLFDEMWARHLKGEKPAPLGGPVANAPPVKAPMFAKTPIEAGADNRQLSRCLFTMSAGRTGTAWLSTFLKANVPSAEVHHEILGYDRFGVDTPDVSHMTLFNSEGNVPKVREFWRQKFQRIEGCRSSAYFETSHLLAKAGLCENLDQLPGGIGIDLVHLERDLLKTVLSYRERGDFRNKGNMWMWYLDYAYPNVIVDSSAFVDAGYYGICIWYVTEMKARAAYYQRLLAGSDQIQFHNLDIDQLAELAGASAFLKDASLDVPENDIELPPPANTTGPSRQPAKEERAALQGLIARLSLDTDEVADKFYRSGKRLSDIGFRQSAT